jgi:cation diffusion facilitator CzcD-associated flavoprotein CzcO
MNVASPRAEVARDQSRDGKATPAVLVIGAGFGGIAAGVKLKEAGIHNFTVVEQSGGLGGTWWDNTYPGLECDIPSHLYSYSFATYDWSRTHASREEIREYLEHVVDRYGIRSHFVFNAKVVRVVWDEATHAYDIHLADGSSLRANVVISAVGMLNSLPTHPAWPGLEDFEGPKFHSARWEPQHDLAGKRIAIVGTGATTSGLVPALAPEAGKIYVFQREPGWCIPKGERDYTPEERSKYRKRWRQLLHRYQIYWNLERGNDSVFPGTKNHRAMQQTAQSFLDEVFKQRPDLKEALTPAYPFWGKRPLINSTLYPALVRENVELVPHAVTGVTRHGVVDAAGVEREVDVLIMATGFQPFNFLATYELCGRDGRSIREVWNGEPEAFLGMMVPGFPNFYMLFGPNTNGVPSVIFFIETEVNFIIRNIKRMIREKLTSIEVRQDFMRSYNEWLQSGLRKTVYQNTNNYYKAATGRIVTNLWLGGTVYWFLSRTLRRASSVGRRLGDGSPASRVVIARFGRFKFALAKATSEGTYWVLTHLVPQIGGGKNWA